MITGYKFALGIEVKEVASLQVLGQLNVNKCYGYTYRPSGRNQPTCCS